MPFKDDTSQAERLKGALEEALMRLERAALDVRARGQKQISEKSDPDAERLARLESENRQLREAVGRLKEQYERLEEAHQDLLDRAESADEELAVTLRQLDRLIEDETIH